MPSLALLLEGLGQGLVRVAGQPHPSSLDRAVILFDQVVQVLRASRPDMLPDRITGLAACWLQVPIVIVSILDSERIGFKLLLVIEVVTDLVGISRSSPSTIPSESQIFVVTSICFDRIRKRLV